MANGGGGRRIMITTFDCIKDQDASYNIIRRLISIPQGRIWVYRSICLRQKQLSMGHYGKDSLVQKAPHDRIIYALESKDHVKAVSVFVEDFELTSTKKARILYSIPQLQRKKDNTYIGTTWQISFKLENVNQNGVYKLRLALAMANQAELQGVRDADYGVNFKFLVSAQL